MHNYTSIDDMLLVLPNCDQALMQLSIDSVSRMIDQICDRVFYQTIGDKEYQITGAEVMIDDFVPDGSTKVFVDNVELASDKYEFVPMNDNPKTRIKLLVTGEKLKIHGSWGYGSLPEQISHAAQFLSRIAYQSLLEKNLKSESIQGYTATYNEKFEHYPTTQLIQSIVGQFRRVRIH